MDETWWWAEGRWQRTAEPLPSQVIRIESDESDSEGGRLSQAPTQERPLSHTLPSSDSDCSEPPPLLVDSDSEDDNVALTSDSDCSEDCGWDADGVDLSLINRTAGDSRSAAKRRRVQPEATTVRPSIASGREPGDPTTPDFGMTGEEMATFLKCSPPRSLLLILAIMFASPCYSNDSCLDVIEYFSGQQAVTKGCSWLGLRAVPYDVINDRRYQDLNGVWGFIAALQLLRMLLPGHGLVWLGTVCSTWVFMSRNSTMRT